ncbi:MAG: asparagine synthase (glutamine-hydrolyzing), partial [Cetobacterium sp.]
RRLSIIDITTGANQPMGSNSKKWSIVFNGEIYNYLELKDELNYDFKTNSDTEVIVASLETKSIEWFLEKANGMFAIAAYNLEDKEMFLIRDRLGIKPLYYYSDNQNFIFASEIKGILNSGLVEAIFNESAIDEYLGNRYVRAPYTFFEKIFQVKPGFYLKINKEKIQEIKYWDLPEEFNVEKIFEEEKIVEEFENELKQAIKIRLEAEVSIGAYLSGGVDSSLITALTTLEKKENINTYTIGFNELNEFKYADIVSKKYDTNHNEIKMTKNDYINNWEELIIFKDSPLGVPNEIPLAVMSEKLKEKITVVLSGEGADELLGGYGRIYRKAFDFYNNKNPLKNEFYKEFIKEYEYVNREIRDSYLNVKIDLRDQFDYLISNDFKNKSNEENIFRFFHKYHVCGLLQRVDTTTMKSGVEARVPFLDYKLIEYSYKNIPYDLKLKWKNKDSKEMAKKKLSKEYSEVLDIPKYILKKLAYKYLPKENIERKKVGFPVPLDEWFGNLKEIAEQELKDAYWLKKEKLQELLNELKNNQKSGQLIWMFINIEKFRRLYFKKEWRY